MPTPGLVATGTTASRTTILYRSMRWTRIRCMREGRSTPGAAQPVEADGDRQPLQEFLGLSV